MDKYIKKIENVVFETNDKSGLEPVYLNEIRLFFFELLDGKKYNIQIIKVCLFTEQGKELKYLKGARNLILPTYSNPSKCRFFFELENGTIELLDGAIFEITIKVIGNDLIETFRYILRGEEWIEEPQNTLFVAKNQPGLDY